MHARSAEISHQRLARLASQAQDNNQPACLVFS